ncbi:MAG: hypothetical protein KAJ19_11460 [Gammaproteobacteria bacterium]|nr:hypothetical protein [Gammaproteobacteria bacterium]
MLYSTTALSKGVAMAKEYDFQKDLHDSIFDADPKLDRRELLTDIFKAYTAKMFEFVITRRKDPENRLPFDAIVEVKKNLISEFRKAALSEHQQSVEWYEKLFDATVQEILAEAATSHGGQESIQLAQQRLEINPEAYIHEGGLFLPKGMRR